jgi:hypothetical protein
MSVLIRLQVLTREALVEARYASTAGDRAFKIPGGDYLSFEMQEIGDRVVLALLAAPEGLGRYKGVRPGQGGDQMPNPPPTNAGTYDIVHGLEVYRAPKKK